jgi:predicted ester cyclase
MPLKVIYSQFYVLRRGFMSNQRVVKGETLMNEIDLASIGNAIKAAKTGDRAFSDRALILSTIDHHPALRHVFGHEALRAFLSQMRKAFSDLEIAVESMVGDNEAIAFAYTLTGTQDGHLMGLAPTGDKIKIHAVFEIQKAQNGRALKQFGQTPNAGGQVKPALA